jgi:two-component system, cell cycle response regulator DivK
MLNSDGDSLFLEERPMSLLTSPARASRILILVADAHADTRSLYEDLLTRAGYEVVGAVDGRDALVKVFSERPTLVITETDLPIIDGFSLCGLLRRDSATRLVPILVVTAETRIAMMEQARFAGADAILNKPVMPDTILAEIRCLLERSQQRMQSAPKPVRERKPLSLVKAHLREQTTAPYLQPPSLLCPTCYRPLRYEYSFVGGVSRRHAEQWDAYVCPVCGQFEYRHRTRKLRHVG